MDITPRLIDLVIQKDATSPTPLNGIVGHGSAGFLGLHGFLLQSHGSYDVGARRVSIPRKAIPRSSAAS